jgi:uncharacterized damage-inducible protein DinB
METQKIIGLLQKSFNGPAWHGPAVMEVLATVTPQEAAHKISTSHSVIELVMHMTTWRNFVTKRLQGDNAFEVSQEENFPKGTDWTAALNALEHSQEELINAINKFSEEKLLEIVPTRKYNFYTMLYGIIQHDIYHTGQIVLLKKAV